MEKGKICGIFKLLLQGTEAVGNVKKKPLNLHTYRLYSSDKTCTGAVLLFGRLPDE